MTLLGVDGVDVAPSAHVEDHEDGEISEQGSIVTGVSKKEEADAGFIPLSEGSARKIVDDLDHTNEEFSDDDDDVPEEMLNIIAKQKAAAAGVIVEEIDPKLCRVCQKEPHKYKCPKCDSRTCSLTCIKQHKADDNCDGVRGPFTVVAKLSQYDEKKSIEDQAFMKTVQQKVYEPVTMSVPAGDASTMKHEGQMSDEQAGCHQQNGPMGDENAVNEDGTRNTAKNMQERYLIPNAGRRRIWLSFSDDKGGEDCTRHEQFSDSIFWCIDFVFTKKLEDGEMSEYTYRVQNIPETIRLCTVLKQFLKPRKYGCIVSESDLDLEKMAPFISAQPESIKMFMRVPRYENERYYVMNSERTLLDNTRNRVIVDHPKIIIVLEDECQNYQSLSEEEAEAIRERMQKERSAQNRNSGFRGRGGRGMGMRGRGGPPGDFGGGFGRGRGGFRGRGGSRGGFDGEGGRGGGWQPRGGGRGFQGGGKRPWNSSGGEDGGWKRGRGRGGSFGRGGGNNFRRDPVDFDPFEPFEGPVTLPMDYGNSPRLPAGGSKEDAAVSSWGKAVGAPKVKEEASGEQ